jgi:uncharacterized protein YigA (DUF484 family)
MARSLDGELARVRTFRELTGAMWQAGDLDDILQGALACLEAIFGVERASILLFDEAGVMRFRAWRLGRLSRRRRRAFAVGRRRDRRRAGPGL